MVEELSSPGGFSDLPYEILHEIFSHLDRVDLCKASRVCRRWHAASRDSSFWKYVDVQVKGPQELEKLILHLPPSVMDLRIRCKVMDEHSPLWLADIMKTLKKRCPSLELLMIEKVHFQGVKVCTSLIKTLKKDKPLSSKEYQCQSETDEDECKCLFGVLCQDQFSPEKMPPNLVVVSLRNSVIWSSGIALRSWKAVAQVRVLDLSYSLCVTRSTRGFFHRLNRLQELYLTGCPVTYAGVEEMVKTISTVKVLDLENTALDARMFASLTDCNSLEELYVGGTVFDDSYVNSLELRTFKRLRILCLRNTYITADGLLELTKRCRTLRNIVVAHSDDMTKIWKDKKYKCIRNKMIYSDSPELCEHFMKKHDSS